MNCRCVMANLVVCAMAAAVMPIGCSGAQQEEPRHVRHASAPRTISEPTPSVEVPEGTALQMKACVDAMNHPSAELSHAFQYTLETNDQGKVLMVNLRDSTLRDAPLEACFERALAAMEVPKDALRLRSSKPVSGGEGMTASRADVGIVQVAAAPIALAPIVIPAVGVTIIVAISLDIIRKATSGPDCKRIKQECIEYCSDTTLPTRDYGWKFQICKNQCLESQGCPRNS